MAVTSAMSVCERCSETPHGHSKFLACHFGLHTIDYTQVLKIDAYCGDILMRNRRELHRNTISNHIFFSTIMKYRCNLIITQ